MAKGKKRIWGILLAIILCGIFIFLFFYNRNIPDHIEYFAKNDFVTIEIHNIKDAETFQKIKPDDMTIIDSLKEVEENGGRFILGSVSMDDEYYQEDSEYKLLIEKKNGDAFYVPVLMKQWEHVNGKVNADFYVTEQGNELYQYLTLYKNEEVIVKFELKQK